MKLRFHLNRFLNFEFFKFLTVGFLNTIVGYTVYVALLFIDTPYLFALIFSTIIGILFNYFSFGRIFFREQGDWLIFCRFFSAYTVIFITNVVMLSTLTTYSIFSPYIAQMICLPLNVILSWSLLNHWVFKR